jgi:hypothetical protein
VTKQKRHNVEAKERQQRQLQRFKELAREVEADESPDALDRAFARLDMKKKAPAKPAKRKS